ncbi:M23 family metallopeptidase [Liberibacter sp. Z1]|nr:M23 family metallopeptidase [Candidatus Liberibacter sp.]
MLFSFGNDPPILRNGDRILDKREVSLRWLSGTFLAGMTSGVLMGVALLIALDGRHRVAMPAKVYSRTLDIQNTNLDTKSFSRRGARLSRNDIAIKTSERTILEVPKLIKEHSKDIIKKVPFAYARMSFATQYQKTESYPKFDPLKIFSGGKIESQSQILMNISNGADAIYNTESELEISIKKSNFPTDISDIHTDITAPISEIEKAIRNQTSLLIETKDQSAKLYYADPQISSIDQDATLTNNTAVRIIEENRTITPPQSLMNDNPEFSQDIIPIRQNNTAIFDAITSAGYARAESSLVAQAFKEKLKFNRRLSKNDVLKIGVLQKKEDTRIIQASIYHKGEHLITIALNDNNDFIIGAEPAKLDFIDNINDIAIANDDFPRVYDGIWRASSFHGMNKNLIQLVIRLLASSVDLQSTLKPTDFLETFFSLDSDSGKASDDSELLYINARLGDKRIRFYRFQNPINGSIEYFNEDGKSARPFLLRIPVLSGYLSSPFGIRLHPIRGVLRMHTGVDWAAPIGTPIMAVGDGVVEKAGLAGGYGKQTLIRHGNGYVSSYNHQNAIAKNIKPGTTVRQGQVIGWVGRTGMATGPHLHYELIVNGTKVDSMKIRIPDRETLKGDLFNRFSMETKRINLLLNNGEKPRKASLY